MTEPKTPAKATGAKAATDAAGEWTVQTSKKIGGDLWNIRAKDGNEFLKVTEQLAINGEAILDNLGQFVQVVIAKGVQTGDFNASENASQKPAERRSTSRAASGPPSCKHGEMKDFGDRNYKHRYYCAAKDRKDQCPAQD